MEAKIVEVEVEVEMEVISLDIASSVNPVVEERTVVEKLSRDLVKRMRE